MISKIDDLASKFEETLLKSARQNPKKKRKGRDALNKNLKGVTEDYKRERKELLGLEKQLVDLQCAIDGCRGKMTGSRKELLKLTDMLKNMDLASCDNVLFYQNDAQDVSYVIDGEEYHMEIVDAGDMKLTPMKEHQLNRRRKLKEENKLNKSDDLEMDEYEEEVEPEVPNLRFID